MNEKFTHHELNDGTFATDNDLKRWNREALEEGVGEFLDFDGANSDNQVYQEEFNSLVKNQVSEDSKLPQVLKLRELKEKGVLDTLREYASLSKKQLVGANKLDELIDRTINNRHDVGALRYVKDEKYGDRWRGRLKKGGAFLSVTYDYWKPEHHQVESTVDKVRAIKDYTEKGSPLNVPYVLYYFDKEGGISSFTIIPSFVKEIMDKIPEDIKQKIKELDSQLGDNGFSYEQADDKYYEIVGLTNKVKKIIETCLSRSVESEERGSLNIFDFSVDSGQPGSDSFIENSLYVLSDEALKLNQENGIEAQAEVDDLNFEKDNF